MSDDVQKAVETLRKRPLNVWGLEHDEALDTLEVALKRAVEDHNRVFDLWEQESGRAAALEATLKERDERISELEAEVGRAWREVDSHAAGAKHANDLQEEAEAEVERLREALRNLMDYGQYDTADPSPQATAARAALERK